MTSPSAAGRSVPTEEPLATPQVKPHGDLGCHDGYKLLSLERPTVYCMCTLGDLARAMDADPLNAYKAERWERVCRSRRPTSGLTSPEGQG